MVFNSVSVTNPASNEDENDSKLSIRVSTEPENVVNPVTELICTWDEPLITPSASNLVFTLTFV